MSAAIKREVAAGYTRGPFSTPPLENYTVSAISACEKPSGDVRLIFDLSQPIGRANNPRPGMGSRITRTGRGAESAPLPTQLL